MEEDAFAVLQNDLYKALSKDDELVRELDALNAVANFLLSIGVADYLLEPIGHIANRHLDTVLRKAYGNAVRPIGETALLAKAAASVDSLKDMGTPVAGALEFTSMIYGLDRKDLKRFRDDILCGRASDIAVLLYKRDLAAVRQALGDKQAHERYLRLRDLLSPKR